MLLIIDRITSFLVDPCSLEAILQVISGPAVVRAIARTTSRITRGRLRFRRSGLEIDQWRKTLNASAVLGGAAEGIAFRCPCFEVDLSRSPRPTQRRDP
jgi:hypothetical protein